MITLRFLWSCSQRNLALNVKLVFRFSFIWCLLKATCFGKKWFNKNEAAFADTQGMVWKLWPEACNSSANQPCCLPNLLQTQVHFEKVVGRSFWEGVPNEDVFSNISSGNMMTDAFTGPPEQLADWMPWLQTPLRSLPSLLTAWTTASSDTPDLSPWLPKQYDQFLRPHLNMYTCLAHGHMALLCLSEMTVPKDASFCLEVLTYCLHCIAMRLDLRVTRLQVQTDNTCRELKK